MAEKQQQGKTLTPHHLERLITHVPRTAAHRIIAGRRFAERSPNPGFAGTSPTFTIIRYATGLFIISHKRFPIPSVDYLFHGTGSIFLYMHNNLASLAGLDLLQLYIAVVNALAFVKGIDG